MADPVVLPCGHSFERRALRKWTKQQGKCCPVDGDTFRSSSDMQPNFQLQWEILFWQRQQQLKGQLRAESIHLPDDTVTSSTAALSSTNEYMSPPPPPLAPFKSLDSPPSRPQRRGSFDGGKLDSPITEATADSSPTMSWNQTCRPAFRRSIPIDCSTGSSHRMCPLPKRNSSYLEDKESHASSNGKASGAFSSTSSSSRPSYPKEITYRDALDVINDAIQIVGGLP